MWLILALIFVLVFARKFWAAGYQMGNNDSAYRCREAFDKVQTPEDFDQLMKSYRNFYMKEDADIRSEIESRRGR